VKFEDWPKGRTECLRDIRLSQRGGAEVDVDFQWQDNMGSRDRSRDRGRDRR
jgi:hypothetical protein